MVESMPVNLRLLRSVALDSPGSSGAGMPLVKWRQRVVTLSRVGGWACELLRLAPVKTGGVGVPIEDGFDSCSRCCSLTLFRVKRLGEATGGVESVD